MKFYIFIFIITFLIIFLNRILIEKSYLISQTGDLHQKFVSKNKIPLTGGFFLLCCSFYFYKNDLKIYFFFLSLIFFTGLLSDLKIFKSPILRLTLQSFIVVFFVYVIDIRIDETKVIVLDNLLKINFFNYLFVSFCLLILINGSNFFDGLNTLNLGYFISIFISILFLNFNKTVVLNGFPLLEIIFIFGVVLILNLLNKLYLGDSGSCLVGTSVGIFLIFLYTYNPHISPFFIVLMLWYPCFEILFSIIRKKILGKSSMMPDTNHLHQLIFFYCKKKFLSNNIYIINLISAFLIILYNLIIFFVSAMFIQNTQIQIILILLNILIYMVIYFKLFLLRYKKNYE
jgi:UDP-N-acetylmuramyl pentapeptide phosphotransferase/UDP-N-acetylglucosamine-1-phosphate transferase